MRKFYIEFQHLAIQQALSAELSWSHYERLMRVENLQARQWCGNIPAKHFHI